MSNYIKDAFGNFSVTHCRMQSLKRATGCLPGCVTCKQSNWNIALKNTPSMSQINISEPPEWCYRVWLYLISTVYCFFVASLGYDRSTSIFCIEFIIFYHANVTHFRFIAWGFVTSIRFLLFGWSKMFFQLLFFSVF